MRKGGRGVVEEGVAHFEGTLGLAGGTGGGLHDLAHVLEEGPKREVAAHAVILDLL